jgi:hypothetical protein
MKLFKKLAAVTLATLALGCGTASANVIEHIHLVMESGGTFDGDVTFADHYTAILGVDGYLAGSSSNPIYNYGNDHITWNWNTYWDDGTRDATGLSGVLTDYLVDGEANTDNYFYYLGISWKAPADKLSILIDSTIPLAYAGVGGADRIVKVTLGDAGTPSDVPEPASIVLLGLGFAGLAATRRRKA